MSALDLSLTIIAALDAGDLRQAPHRLSQQALDDQGPRSRRGRKHGRSKHFTIDTLSGVHALDPEHRRGAIEIRLPLDRIVDGIGNQDRRGPCRITDGIME